MTPWGASNPSSLVLKSPESRVSSIGDFRVLEKTPLLLRFLPIHFNPCGLSLKSFGDVFLKSSSSSPQNLTSFGLDLIVQLSSFSKIAGWKNPVLLWQDFSLSSVEPTFALFCVGSTGEWFFHVLGFFRVFCGCTGASNSTCIGSTGATTGFAVSLVQPAYRFS